MDGLVLEGCAGGIICPSRALFGHDSSAEWQITGKTDAEIFERP
jgi:hypothetical protein